MKAYICDRCGETYTENKVPTTGRISGGIIGGINLVTMQGHNDASIDLCDNCVNDLFKFMGNQTVYKQERTEGL